MTTVVLFPPNDPSEPFENVTDVNINNASGLLTFYWRDGGQTKKFQTTVPYTVREEIAG
jgi:hypothetical protein